MIQKIKLDFTPSVNLGPIIVDIITKNKNINRCSSWDRTSNASVSHTSNILVYHYLIILFVLFLPTLMSHRATQIFYQHFFRTVIFSDTEASFTKSFPWFIFYNRKTFVRPMCIHELCSAVNS